MSNSPFRVGVLASGEGTNLEALLRQVHGRDGIEIVAVGSNVAAARALERAAAAGVAHAAFPSGEHPDRAARDSALAAWFAEREVQLVVLAGYLELITPSFLKRWPRRVINVHPALLPAFPGLHAIEQALAYGVKVFGVTVHVVDEGVDTGPVILQRAVAIPDARTPDDVLTRLRPLEHQLLPEAVRLFAAGRVRFDEASPRRIVVTD